MTTTLHLKERTLQYARVDLFNSPLAPVAFPNVDIAKRSFKLSYSRVFVTNGSRSVPAQLHFEQSSTDPKVTLVSIDSGFHGTNPVGTITEVELEFYNEVEHL